jgi:hypothetical protein
MKFQKYIGILSVVAAIAGLGSTASAVVPCNRAIPTGPFFCGTSRAQASYVDGGRSVKYHVASNGRPVNGVPVTAAGVRVPKVGGGTCPQVSATRAGQLSEFTCPMVRPTDAKRYVVNEL